MPQSFSGKCLQGRSFKNQDLAGADFSQADIRGTDFTNAILIGANFNQAIAGLQRRSVLFLIAVLCLLGILAVFTIGVVAAFTGAVLIPGQCNVYQSKPQPYRFQDCYSYPHLLAICKAT